MPVAAKLTYGTDDGVKTILVEGLESLMDVARAGDEVPLYDQSGQVVGRFIANAPPDEAADLTDEDREDIADARAAMKDIEENGSIPWEQVKAELGL